MMLVLYGPTVTGKTDLAIQLARKFHGEIISADSRQVYRGLDIGTGKVKPLSKVEKHKGYWIVDGVKIHGFDLVKAGKKFSVADFVKLSSTTMIQIIEARKLPIIVGGTGFYIKSLLEPIGSLGVLPNPKLRKSLGKLSATQLYKKLEEVNLQKAKSLNQSERNNPRRLIRAIEIATHALPTSEVSQGKTKHTSEVDKMLFIGLTAPNDYLYKRADGWLKKRINHGLIEEVESLIRSGVSISWLESLGLEYRWITRFLVKRIAREQALQRLRGDIHDFIRRQKTYLRQFASLNIQIFDISNNGWQNKLEKKVKSWYTEEHMRN